MKIINDYKKLGPKATEVVTLLYQHKKLTNSELTKLLKTSPTSLYNIINKILEFTPPILEREKRGKCVYFSLTEEAKLYCETKFERFNPLLKTFTIHNDMLRIILLNVLNSIDSNRETNIVKNIKKLGVDNLMSIFEPSEIFFLFTILGIFSDPIPLEKAMQLSLPYVKENEYNDKGLNIYKRLKNAIIEMEFKQIETEIFGFSDDDTAKVIQYEIQRGKNNQKN